MNELGRAAEEVVPHFFRHMPKAYFRENDRATRRRHLQAIVAAEAIGLKQELTLRGDDQRVTVIDRRSYPGQLAEMLSRLPHDRPLRSASIHTASDGSLALDIFEFGEGEPVDQEDPLFRRRRRELERTAPELLPLLTECPYHALAATSAEELEAQLRLLQRIADSQRAEVVFSQECLTVGLAHGDGRHYFERAARYLASLELDIERAALVELARGISLVTFVLSGLDGERVDSVTKNLFRLDHLDGRTLKLAQDMKLPLEQAEALVCQARLNFWSQTAELKNLHSRERCLEMLLESQTLPAQSDVEGRRVATLRVDSGLFVHGKGFEGFLRQGSLQEVAVERRREVELEALRWLADGACHQGSFLFLEPGADREQARAVFAELA